MTRRAGWVPFASLAALAVAGQAAAVRLVDAPRYAVYQHYVDWPALLSRSPLSLGILALQALVCVTLAVRDRADCGRLLGQFTLLRGIAVVGVVAFGAAVPTADAARFAREVLLAVGVLALAGLNLWHAARALPDALAHGGAAWVRERVTLDDAEGPPRRWDRALPWLLAAWVVIVAASLSVVVFERLPHIDDSVSYYFQARVFAAGRLWLPAPPDSTAFHVDEVIIAGGKWFGYAFPAWPATLAIGVAIGAPWLVNPLLGGLTVLLGHALVRRLSGRGDANLVALLLAGSPWLLWMSAEYMGHPLAGVLTLGVLLAAVRAREAPGWRWGAAGGVVLGLLALTRPLDAVLVGLVGAGWLALSVGMRAATRTLAAAAPAAALVAALMLPYDRALTGRATYTPHTLWTDRAWGPGVDRVGFGSDVGIPAWRNIDPLPGHGPADVVLNWNKNLFAASTDVFGWACGSLTLVWIGLALAGWRRSDLLPALTLAGFVGGYAAYWFSGGPDLGPRYWFPALVPMAALTVRAGRTATHRLTRSGAPRVFAAAALAVAGAMLCYMPWRALTRYRRYRGVSGDVRSLAATRGFDRSLVLLTSDAREDYQSAFSLNPLSLDASAPVYARSVGTAQTARVVAAFPDRPVWVIARDPRSGRLVLRAGPLAPGTDQW